jgi:flagellar hook-associated protein 2
VQTLARSQKLSSAAFATTATGIGTGTLTFEFGTYSGGAFSPNADKPSATVSIAPGQDSLAGVRDAINAAAFGATASIVNDGTGQRLVITSTDTGLSSALRISVADDDGLPVDNAGLSQLAYDASTGGTTNLAEAVAADDAKIVIDGITIRRASNTVSDALEGVTLNLLKAAPGTTTTLKVSRNVDAAVSSVISFVQSYNSAASSLGTLSAYNADTKTGAVLQGDSTLLSIQSRLRSVLGAAVSNTGGYASLSELGISFQRDGTLLTDSTKLRAALSNPAKDASTALAAVGTPSDSLVKYGAASTAAVAGSYALQVTQLATRGAAVGSAPTALVITAGVNDTLDLSVDGTAASVTLTAGTYTASTLATMLQSRINGNASLSAAGRTLEAAESGGTLTLTSKRWGTASSVALTGGTALADLFGSPVATDGVDAAGTIGGVAAVGSGKTLSAQGLTVSIEGGTTGARGTLDFSRGTADRLSTLIGDLLNGALQSRTTGLQTSIKNIASQRDAFEARMVQVEANMRAQYIALDSALTSMQNTSSFLTQQLANLPKISSS